MRPSTCRPSGSRRPAGASHGSLERLLWLRLRGGLWLSRLALCCARCRGGAPAPSGMWRSRAAAVRDLLWCLTTDTSQVEIPRLTASPMRTFLAAHHPPSKREVVRPGMPRALAGPDATRAHRPRTQLARHASTCGIRSPSRSESMRLAAMLADTLFFFAGVVPHWRCARPADSARRPMMCASR